MRESTTLSNVSLSSINKVNDEHIRLLRQDQIGRMLVKRISKFLLYKGPTRPERMLNTISEWWVATTSFINNTCKERAKKILFDFLKHTSENHYYVQQKFVNYYLGVEKLQNWWHSYKKIKANRMQFLVFKWEYEFENMVEFWQNSKQKKYKVLLK